MTDTLASVLIHAAVEGETACDIHLGVVDDADNSVSSESPFPFLGTEDASRDGDAVPRQLEVVGCGDDQETSSLYDEVLDGRNASCC